MAPPPPNSTNLFLGGYSDQARRRLAMLGGFYEGLPMFHLPAQTPECARGEKEAFDVGIRINWRKDGRHDLLTPLNEPVVAHESFLRTVAADVYGYRWTCPAHHAANIRRNRPNANQAVETASDQNTAADA